MPLVNNDIPIISLTTLAEILKTKPRTLRMYQDRDLLPKSNGLEKKLYSLNDAKQIGLIHYLASIKKINASGIRYILEMIDTYLTKEEREKLLDEIEESIIKSKGLEVEEGVLS